MIDSCLLFSPCLGLWLHLLVLQFPVSFPLIGCALLLSLESFFFSFVSSVLLLSISRLFLFPFWFSLSCYRSLESPLCLSSFIFSASPNLHRLSKLQKIHTNLILQENSFPTYQQSETVGSSSEGNPSYHTDDQIPAYNLEQNQEDKNTETEPEEPFFYYQEDIVQESVNQCRNSIIGKILSDKPIPIQVLHNTLSGIWCNPQGFKITEIEGKLL